MSSFAFLITAIVAYLLIAHRTGDWLAPCAVLCLFWFSAAALADVSSLKDLTLQQQWEVETYIAIYLSGLSVFFIGILLGKKRHIGKIETAPSTIFRFAVNVLIILSICAVMARLYVFGFSLENIWLSFGGLDLKDELSEAIPFVHYFEILTPYLCLCAIFELSSSTRLTSVRKLILSAFVFYTIFIYCLLLTASRGTLLIVLCGAIFLYSQTGRLRMQRIIILVAGLVCLMVGLSMVRMSSETLTNSFLGDGLLRSSLSPIYTYVAFNFENLNTLVRSDLPLSYVYYSLKFLMWPFLKSDYELGIIGLTNFDTLFFNARTYIYPFYHDLGLIGCVIYPSVIALVLVNIHNAANRQQSRVLVLMALQKPIWFAFFGNYFFGELVLLIPLLVVYFLSVIYKKRTNTTLPTKVSLQESVLF